MSTSEELENEYNNIEKNHLTNKERYYDIGSYYTQAFIGTINLTIGIAVTGFMIYKNKYL
jgi:hypothetical protein|tara:strand:+ start:304 stop:483 length:180 start_codon:yes stop_codon:yes gene_type:complete